MKRYIKQAAVLLAALSVTSCIDLEELNVNPNNASTTTPSLLLTGISYTAFNQSSFDVCHATKMLVQTDGESVYQVFKWTRGSFGYYGNLRNVTKMAEEAEEGSAFQALAKFFRANYFYQLTMNFGSIPYTQALKGDSELVYQPAYDSQETVLEGILNELAEADQILQNSTETITGDIIYQGNLDKWRRLINAYRLRILMTLSGKTTVGSINVRATFADIANNKPLMRNADDNGQLVYLDQAGNRYNNFNNSSFGSGRYMDSTFVAALAIRKDPRLFAFATQTPNAEKAGKAINDFTAYDGGDPAVPYNLVNDKALAGNCSKPATRYYKSATNEPMILLDYTEQQLILAEAVVRGWIEGDDKSYYESAVKASFEFYQKYATGVSDYLTEDAAETYLLGENVVYTSELSTEEKIEHIAMQKYLPTFLQGRSWLPYYEALRTGYPDFRRAPGVTLPCRWMYPQDEYNNNTANVEDALNEQFGGSDKIGDKTWWMK